MAQFPRGVKAMPRWVSPPRFPEALQSWGQSGRGQFRSTQNIGRVWTEVYPLMNTGLATVRALMEAINRSLRGGVLWDVQVPYWHRRLGAGGGSPLVNGVSQTGSSLIIDGASTGVANWLRAGDLVKVPGCPVVFDVTEDVDSDGSGNVTIPIHPPIFVGQSPANNAAVEIDAGDIFFSAYIVSVEQFPMMDVTEYIDAGMTVHWREQPASV